MLQDCLAETTTSIFPHTGGKTKSEESRTTSGLWVEFNFFGGIMHSTLLRCLFVATIFIPACLMAQQWEIGAAGGFGWYADPTINNTAGSVQAGLKPSFAFGVTSDQDMYNYIGGELRYTFRSGQPELKSHGTVVSGGGYTNVVTYELLVYTSPRESKIRPFVAGGAGIKVYTSTNKAYANQPLANFALLTQVNQVEPAISAGGGVKCMFSRHGEFRLEFRTYMTPLPDRVFRLTGSAKIRGWLFDFVPLAGISYTF
jgi:hypothetical protein